MLLLMSPTPQNDVRSPSPFISGYGVVMKQEHALQSSIGKALGALGGPHAAAMGRVLRHQRVRLRTNIALLEHRYGSLPHPERFQALHRMLSPLSKTRRVAADPEQPEILSALVAQHLNLTTSIDRLLARRRDVQRGEVNLAEVAKNHDEMAWMLTALIKEGETVRIGAARADDGPRPGLAEMDWENEGGALSPGPSPRRDDVVESLGRT